MLEYALCIKIQLYSTLIYLKCNKTVSEFGITQVFVRKPYIDIVCQTEIEKHTFLQFFKIIFDFSRFTLREIYWPFSIGHRIQTAKTEDIQHRQMYHITSTNTCKLFNSVIHCLDHIEGVE